MKLLSNEKIKSTSKNVETVAGDFPKGAENSLGGKPSRPFLGINRGCIKEWAFTLAEALVIILVMFCVCWPYQLDGESMSPGFNSGDRVVMSRFLVAINKVGASDVIACNVRINGQTKKVIKRLIGMPGDLVEIFGGDVYLNGALMDEGYVYGQKTSGNISVLLGEDEYFVLGDNRWLSVDSRDFGVVERNDIIGKIFFKFYPFNGMKRIT